MSAALLIVSAVLLFILAFFTYGSYISKKMGIDPTQKTPAHELRDEVDYLPARAPVLLGHHFASIAGAGPILGPVIASAFGWLPVFLWIILGGIFLGGVHDMSSMVASLRHRGQSIGQIIEAYMGVPGKKLFIIFAYLTMILVIAVFCKIVATTFVTVPSVATSSILFILVAVLFGLGIYRRKFPLLPSTLIGILLLIACISFGSRYPFVIYDQFEHPRTRVEVTTLIEKGDLSSDTSPALVQKVLMDAGKAELAHDVNRAEKKAQVIWIFILMIYVSIAAITPVWILLQPRDYLNSFLLYALVFGGIFGILFTRPTVVLPELTRFRTDLGMLFPVLFVTVACGAISGFHSLVASGTTSKQIDREPDAKLIGYGGMLIESAILALLAAATMVRGRYDMLYRNGDFIAIFSEGIGWFMSKIPLISVNRDAAITFSGLAVAAFAMTTLDTCTRLARFAFQEYFQKKEAHAKSSLTTNRYIGTAVTIVFSVLLIFSGSSSALWPIFGSANQLLAALALLAVTVWLTHLKRPAWFTRIPMFFMYTVTLTALVFLIIKNLTKGNYALTIAGLFLMFVALLLAFHAVKKRIIF
jgi:carbon starvation protein